MNKQIGLSIISTLLLCGCGGSGANEAQQPLQPGQPAQRPAQSVSTVPAIEGGQNPTTPIPFNQPFRLANMEYQFMAARGKDFVGLEANPAVRPSQGNNFFLVRYQVINRGTSNVTVPNTAAVRLLNISTNLYYDLDQAATNANIRSGAATGMVDQLTLEPGQPQIQTLAFQLPSTVDPAQVSIVVTDPADPTKVFQAVKLGN